MKRSRLKGSGGKTGNQNNLNGTEVREASALEQPNIIDLICENYNIASFEDQHKLEGISKEFRAVGQGEDHHRRPYAHFTHTVKKFDGCELHGLINKFPNIGIEIGRNTVGNTDLKILASIPIKHLILVEKELTDISPLASLTSLQTLDISENKNLTDISPLVNLISLQTLNLSLNVRLRDISPLANLTFLQTLDLSENDITDISPLANLTTLQTLYLFYNEITDISHLANITSLQTLDLSYNINLTDISPLANITSLQTLDLSYTSITDISPLAKLTNTIFTR
jgi:hypothetical protein